MRLRTPDEIRLEIERLKVKILRWAFNIQAKERPTWERVLYNTMMILVVLALVLFVGWFTKLFI